ncbi:hypothetical protein L596_021333 [Steinernema carpocapsae]|uniref:Uncharacterized protein n=1 Tax=Steinernema carpocapsae TaxID=34508 RepID=A0A4U5MIT1_STECR|nr:hypothetical protein L596_021333 [Steinernema carpocapsae]
MYPKFAPKLKHDLPRNEPKQRAKVVRNLPGPSSRTPKSPNQPTFLIPNLTLKSTQNEASSAVSRRAVSCL